MSESFRVPGIVCLSCGETIDGAQHATGPGTAPTAGAVSLCFYCGNLTVFEQHALGYLYLRPPTDAERAEMLRDTEIVRAIAAVRAFHEGENAALHVEQPPASVDALIDAVANGDVVICLGSAVDIATRESDGAIGSAIAARMFNPGGISNESIANALRVLADSITERR